MTKLRIVVFFILVFNLIFTNAQKKISFKIKQPKSVSKPDVFFTSVNNDNKSVVYWNSQPNTNLSFYNIYRDTIDSSKNDSVSWIKVGRVFDQNNNYFIDNTSFANNRSYNYFVTAVDNCGNELSKGVNYSTINLKIDESDYEKILLKWNKYTDGNVFNYKIYKGYDLNQLLLTDSVSADINNYTDTSKIYSKYYMIEINTETKLYDSQGVLLKVTSNRQERITSKLKQIYDAKSITYFKNGAELNIIFPYYNRDKFNLKIFDLSGKQLYSKQVNTEDIKIQWKSYKGIFIMTFKGLENIIHKKIIIY